ncbi:MAG: type II toxin-antitoxin system Phd/YefM family antitoxin [Desulfovibrio sp.]|jgi:prevent-host-death family protein|nr:type II toxin-antitoxin system Phd/YefM family antitoxin [Desulfovibrio sp.]
MITMTSRDFNQNAGQAKLAAMNGPVFITDRGRPAHVLLSFEEYRKLAGSGKNVLELLASPETAPLDFDPAKLRDGLLKAADFS